MLISWGHCNWRLGGGDPEGAFDAPPTYSRQSAEAQPNMEGG